MATIRVCPDRADPSVFGPLFNQNYLTSLLQSSELLRSAINGPKFPFQNSADFLCRDLLRRWRTQPADRESSKWPSLRAVGKGDMAEFRTRCHSTGRAFGYDQRFSRAELGLSNFRQIWRPKPAPLDWTKRFCARRHLCLVQRTHLKLPALGPRRTQQQPGGRRFRGHVLSRPQFGRDVE